MSPANSPAAPTQSPCRHADAEEYAAFVRWRMSRHDSINRLLLARKRFVEAYPDLGSWFTAPLPERVGRLYLPGEEHSRVTCRVCYEARAYLYFLALRGHAGFDYEWLVAIRHPALWEFLRCAALSGEVEGLVEQAEHLGYSESARDRIGPLVARIYLHTLRPGVGAIGGREIDELAEAVEAFAERPDVGLFFGSEERYREEVSRQYRTSLHLLRTVLYHSGRLAAEPRKFQPRRERPGLRPEMEVVVERYLSARRLSSRPATVSGFADTVRRFGAWLADEHPEIESFAGVAREHVLEYAAALDEEKGSRTGSPLAPNTKRGRLSRLSTFFRETAGWGWEDVPGRPLLGPGDLPKMPQSVPRYIPEDELARLMEAARRLPCPYQRAALLIARWSGARRDEIRRLEVACLDAYPDGTPRLRIPAGKTYAERMVPLHEEAAEAIRILQRLSRPGRGLHDDRTGALTRYLFVNRGKLFSMKYLFQASLREACGLAGLVTPDGKPTVSPHRFRHTMGTELAERGAKLHTIMKVLGHASPQMSLVYAQISDREVLRDYQKVLGPGEIIAGPAAEKLRSGELPASDVEWLKSNFFKTELELGHCLRLPQEGPCECDLYLSCTKFVTTKEYAPRLRARRKRERELIEDAVSNGWEREVERHRYTIKRIDQLLLEMGESVKDTGESG